MPGAREDTLPGSVPQVRAVTLTSYVEVAMSLGVDPYELLRDTKIPPEDLTDPEARFAASNAVRLVEETARRSGCQCLGLLLAEPRDFASLGFVSLLLQHRGTMRDVMLSLVEHQKMLNDVVDMALDDSGEIAIFRADILFGLATRETLELAVGVPFRALQDLSGGRWHPERIHFRHSAPDDLSVHRRFFRVPIEFNSDFDGIVCSSASLELPIRSADAQMARHAEQFLDMVSKRRNASSLSEQVRRVVHAHLSRGTATMEQVSSKLGLHSRALQRLLDQEGTTFADVLNGVRRQLAARYLADSNRSVLEVGIALGYSTASSFSRWFTSEFGQPPASWRRTSATKFRIVIGICRVSQRLRPAKRVGSAFTDSAGFFRNPRWSWSSWRFF